MRGSTSRLSCGAFREAIAASGLAFRVESEARLIIGGFTGFLLWRDLDEHWQRFVQRPLVRQLLDGKLDEVPALAESAHGSDGPAAVAALDAVVATAPIPADGAQAGAIAAARAGHSFVLEGPPGTGKSQTITNILADQLAQGRRVLFVAEKGAALDVVRQRLGEIGLLPYALDLHDHNARPVEVRARIRTALAQRAQPDLDGYRAALGEVEGSASALRGYAQRLHRANRAGLSLWSARATALARGAGPTLTVPPAVLGEDATTAAAAGGENDGRYRSRAAAATWWPAPPTISVRWIPRWRGPGGSSEWAGPRSIRTRCSPCCRRPTPRSRRRRAHSARSRRERPSCCGARPPGLGCATCSGSWPPRSPGTSWPSSAVRGGPRPGPS